MLIPQIFVNVKQKTNKSDKSSRNATYDFLFITSLEYTATWSELTNSGVLTIPRKTYIIEQNTKQILTIRSSENSTSKYEYESRLNNVDVFDKVNISNTSSTQEVPIFRAGDIINLEFYYNYFKETTKETTDEDGNITFEIQEELKETKRCVLNNHYIASVDYGDDEIVIKFEDNMYLCKQTALANIQYLKGKNIDNQIKDVIKKTLLKVNKENGTNLILEIDDFKSNLENFTLYSSNETFAQFLKRLKELFHFEVYFVGDALQIRYLIPITNQGSNEYPLYIFGDNIVEDSLEYKLNTDMKLTATGTNSLEKETGETTKDGHKKKKKFKLEVYSFVDKNGNIKSVQIGKEKTGKLELVEKIPTEDSGERRCFPYPLARNIDELASFVEAHLIKYNYTGYRGSFTTFLAPLITFSDVISLYVEQNSERNGNYRVKSVKYNISNSGARQEIELENLIKNN